MAEQIHGHDVMQMIADSSVSYTKESLKKEIDDKFGKDAKFYTCSSDNMSGTELIDFLEGKGKFIAQGDGFTTDSSKICKH